MLAALSSDIDANANDPKTNVDTDVGVDANEGKGGEDASMDVDVDVDVDMKKKGKGKQKKQEKVAAKTVPFENIHTVLISLDEAHPLTSRCYETGSQEWSPYFSVRRLLRTIITKNVFLIFSSTTGKLSSLIPPTAEDPSARITNHLLWHHAPICGISYDLMARGSIEANKHSVTYYSSIENMSKFGRPL